MDNFEDMENFKEKKFKEYAGECGDDDKTQSSEASEFIYSLRHKYAENHGAQDLEEVGAKTSRSTNEFPPFLMEPLDKLIKDHWALLPPDHTLLKNFQKLLREHLYRTKDKLANEVAETKYQLEFKKQSREEVGVKLYAMQQELATQNERLEQYAHNMQDYIAKRQLEEQAVAQIKKDYEHMSNLKNNLKSQYNKRMVELENIQALEDNIRKWANEVEDEVKNAKRAVNKGVQLQQQLSEDKRKSDMLFFHIDVEIKKREKELEDLNDEEHGIHEIIDVLKLSISNANADLEVLQNEHKRLTQGWSEEIVAISHRDQILHRLNEATNRIVSASSWLKPCITVLTSSK